MIQRYISNDGEYRRNDVGTIQSSAQSYFNDCYIHIRILEVFESHRRCQFEECRTKWLKEFFLVFHKLCDILLADRRSVDTNTLFEIYDMWGCVKTYTIAACLQ